MAQNSKIEWTTHTFNPWWGCVEVSAACDHCYARTLGMRFGTEWGKNAPRKFFSEKHWREPLKWNQAAAGLAERPRVFCASMADVFEENDTLIAERERLWSLIDATPNLIWLLLTKRPHLMNRFAPADWAGGWPDNVWAMTTVEDQIWADARIPWLMQVPAVVRGLSVEPVFESIMLPAEFLALGSRAWIITGGESGREARPGHPEWYRTLRDQATGAGVPLLFKQWGEWQSAPSLARLDHKAKQGFVNLDGTWETEPYPGKVLFCQGAANTQRVGKHVAGRLLDGRTWDEYPAGGTS